MWAGSLKSHRIKNDKFCLIFNDQFTTEEEEDRKIKEFENFLKDPKIPIDIIVVTSKKWIKFKKDNITVFFHNNINFILCS